MKPRNKTLLSFASVLLFTALWAASAQTQADFLNCLVTKNYTEISQFIYTTNNSSFLSVLNFSIQNLRFTSPETPKPQVIVTPADESHIQTVLQCSKENGMTVRLRSGGHDFEGLSYISKVPFVLIDLINLRSINVNVTEGTAWVEGGANLGELYYSISKASRTLGFPAGVWPTIGAGGHISGAGYGNLIRKYGVSADWIIDIRFMDSNGNIYDAVSIGKDLFWAIKGGGGSSFGILLAYKLKLVPVPEIVTVFNVSRTLEQKATALVHRWQYIAPNVTRDLTLRITIRRVRSSEGNKMTIQATFFATFFGRADRLVQVMRKSFPELGLVKKDCIEMSWIESNLYFASYRGQPPEVLLNRTLPPKPYFKAKSDYVTSPISSDGLQGIWKIFYQPEAKDAWMDLIPYGGRMQAIPESKIAFPHRAGNLYKILYVVRWDGSQSTTVSQNYIDWIRRLYNYMTPFVSNSPRASFFPYRDLDLGVNNIGNTSYEQATVWGFKYFKSNFRRLTEVKRRVDPENFFHDEQSIPLVSS